MRHRKRIAKLGRAADQRNAMMRSLATNLFQHDQIVTTLPRAKALRQLSDKIVTLAKKGDLHSIRQVAKLVYHKQTGELMLDKKTGKKIPETVLRRIFNNVADRYAERQGGGYTRIVPAPPRRGDAAPMAVIELVN